MNTVPLAIALLTASHPTSATIPDSFEELCFAVVNHHHLTCGLVRQDYDPYDGRVEFLVEDAAYDEFVTILPWSDRFPDVSVERISTERYNNAREHATVGGTWFDFRGGGRNAPGGNVLEIMAWGEPAQSGALPTRITLDMDARTVSTDGGPPETPSAFVDSRLAAGSSECSVAVMGGFMKGAFEYGALGAGGGATLGSFTGIGAVPLGLAFGFLGAAWGAVTGSLDAAADHCYGGNDKPNSGQGSTNTGQGNIEGSTDTNEGQEGGDSGKDGVDGGDTGGDSDGGESVADGGDTDDDAGGVCEPDTGDATPDPNSVEMTEESAAAVATLGLGGRPALEPTTKFDSLIDPQREEVARSRVARRQPTGPLSNDWLILHDGSADDNDWWGPIDPHDFDFPSIAPIDPPTGKHGRP